LIPDGSQTKSAFGRNTDDSLGAHPVLDDGNAAKSKAARQRFRLHGQISPRRRRRCPYHDVGSQIIPIIERPDADDPIIWLSNGFAKHGRPAVETETTPDHVSAVASALVGGTITFDRNTNRFDDDVDGRIPAREILAIPAPA